MRLATPLFSGVLLAALLCGLTLPGAFLTPQAHAGTTLQTNGTDSFAVGSSAFPQLDTAGDAFAAGGSIILKGHIAGDAHAAGLDLDIGSEVGGDLYAAGAAVALRAPVAGDLTLIGLSVRTSDKAVVTGNARFLAGTVTVEGPVRGALAATAGELTLNAPVGGDVLLQAATIAFGRDARIGGTLVYSAPAPVDIPARVIPADRVTFHQARSGPMGPDMRETFRMHDMPALPTSFSVLMGFLVTLGFLIVLGALGLHLAPARIERLRQSALGRPAVMVLYGVIGISTLVGLVPVSAMTVLGLPLVPVVVLGLMLLWTLGYLFGVYVLSLRLFAAFGGNPEPGPGIRVSVLAGGLVAMMLLNFVPVLGWIINLALMLFGAGALTGLALTPLAALSPPLSDGPVPEVPGQQSATTPDGAV